jgi:hypothetical protein
MELMIPIGFIINSRVERFKREGGSSNTKTSQIFSYLKAGPGFIPINFNVLAIGQKPVKVA